MGLLSANNLVAVYTIIVGIAMIGLWISLFLTNQILELKPASYAPKLIAYHLVVEFLTAIMLIVSGIGLFLAGSWAKNLSFISLGMLLYTVINSPGKYAQENNLPMVAMFTTLTLLTILAIIALFKFS